MHSNSDDSSFNYLFQEIEMVENHLNDLNKQKSKNSITKLNEELRSRINTATFINSPKKIIYFPKQSIAIDYQKSNPHLIVFSQQITLSGSRKYLVTSMEHFLSFYFKMNESNRHFYEIIVDGMYCKLYFDLEFNYLINTDIDGDQIVHEFIIFIQQMILKYYGLTIENENFLWLDSSTKNKYSCHLIVNTGSYLFENNLEVGNFVKTCEIEAKKQNFNQFFMISNNSHSNTTKHAFFADLTVYSKNRNFRFYLSSKNGINVALKRSKYCTFKNEPNLSVQDIFFNSLIIVNPFINPLENKQILPKINFDNQQSNESSKLINRFFNNKACEVINQEYFIPDHILLLLNEKIIEYIISNLNSDDFNKLSSIINKNPIKQEAFIRKISAFQTFILYDIVNWRYCRRIGRSHKSNRIYFKVDLISKNVYQCCYDIECRKFQSNVLFNVYEALSQNSYIIDETTCYIDNNISKELANHLLSNMKAINDTIIEKPNQSNSKFNTNVSDGDLKNDELNDSLIIQVDNLTIPNNFNHSISSYGNLEDSKILKLDSISIQDDLF